jgi:peptidoglycan/LPS O-acetylase OafA/YrhL
MIKNPLIKILVYIVLYLVISWLTFYLFETPFLFETAFAEEATAEAEKKAEPIVAENQQQTPKTYSEIL